MASIQLEGVSVSFPIYDGASRSLKKRLVAASIGGNLDHGAGNRLVVTAVKSLNLRVDHGERIALIGHNGAGKTTLLRVMAGIYEPQVGRVAVKGQIAPLFDTSFGMDPDATGYENVRVRALYLGMSQRDLVCRPAARRDAAAEGS
jgi:ABC-type polysaccharide/polyol phosphate transport system ATPase subunit